MLMPQSETMEESALTAEPTSSIWDFTSVLLFTVNVAGGHLTAADALKTNILEKNPTATVERIELYKALFGRKIADGIAALWNTPQRSEWTSVLSLLQSLQPFFDLMLYLPLLIYTLMKLNKYKANDILSTQPHCHRAFTHAARILNWWHGKKIKVHIFLTEESGCCPHYFTGLRSLRPNDRKVLTLHAPKPVMHKDNENDEQFWIRHTGLSLKSGEIVYTPPLVRAGFWQAADRPKWANGMLEHTVVGRENIDLAAPLLTPQQASKMMDESLLIQTSIAPQDMVILIMLASQACSGATLAYLAKFAEQLSQNSCHSHRRCHLYIACANNFNLFRDVCQAALKYRFVCRMGLDVIPLSYQNDRVLGQIMGFADATITKSGGMTVQELQVAARNAKHLIHVPCEPNHQGIIDYTHAKSCMILHEWENYCALAKKTNAQLINPRAFPDHLLHPILGG